MTAAIQLADARAARALCRAAGASSARALGRRARDSLQWQATRATHWQRLQAAWRACQGQPTLRCAMRWQACMCACKPCSSFNDSKLGSFMKADEMAL